MLLHEWLERASEELGNAKALVYRDNYLSWRGLRHRVERRAQEFHAMGIKEGDWVGLMLGNVPDFVILALALSKLGAAIAPIDPTTATREFELMMDTVPLRALITRPRGSDGQPASAEPARRPPFRLVEDKKPKNDIAETRRRLQGTLLMCSVFKRPPPDSKLEPEVILFTADSAGDPKGVLRTRENLEAIADNVSSGLEVDGKTQVLTAVPLFHAYGWDFGFLAPMKHGATMYLEEELSAKRVAKILKEEDVDILPGTPSLYAGLGKMVTAKPLKRKGARFVSAGSRLDAEVAEAFRERYGVRLMSAYHTTETSLVSLDKSTKSPTSVGKIIDGIEMRLSGSDGSKIGPNEKGVIWVRGETVAAASMGPYEPLALRAGRVPVGGRDQEGWFRTGDVGRCDKSGRLFIEGREDDLVKVDGKRVALGEVEGCLEAFPKVKRAQALVITDPLAGQIVVARVVASAKCQAEEIIDHCARNLAPYKVPRRIEFCDSLD
ncbi:MAG: acyl--CoA ligase [Deltaproteobacteria bacterium]|nr:acyl--CoA ligase [Deltaproteobacteria bacterium]